MNIKILSYQKTGHNFTYHLIKNSFNYLKCFEINIMINKAIIVLIKLKFEINKNQKRHIDEKK